MLTTVVLRRLSQLVILALLVGAGWVAAPALSMAPYVPRAVDFEQPLTGLARVGPVADGNLHRKAAVAKAGEGAVSYRSDVIAAPDRFDLAGLAGELRPLEIRARESGGEWSDWVESGAGDPVYFGGSDELQLRARGYRPAGELHYVNVSGSTTAAGGLLTSVRRSINTAFVSAAGFLDPVADALPARPTVIGRPAWGANQKVGGCRPRVHPIYGRVKAAVVHHTVTANEYSAEEAPAIVLGICRYHRNGNGWNDIGYNALVDRFGNIYAGRAGGLKRPVVGAHAQGFNAQTSGVAVIGTHTKVPITPQSKGALVEWLSWRLAVSGLNAIGKTTLVSAGGDLSRYPSGRRVRLNRVIGHGTVGLTECPGAALALIVPKLRHLVQERIDAGGGVAPDQGTDPAPTDDGGVTPK